MKILDKVNLNTALEVFSSYAALYVPAGDEAFSSFVHYSPGLKIFLAKNTTLGPKYLLFPKAESLYSYATCGKEAEISSPPQESKLTIIFGIRSCDLQALACLDDVFLAQNNRIGFNDQNYKANRDHTLTVALSCLQPEVNCFCQSMGVDSLEHSKADLQLFDLGTCYGFEGHSSKGLELSHLLENAGLLAEQEIKKPLPSPFSLSVDTQGITDKLPKMFGHSLWDDLGKRCLNCGACTYVCPACHCFDISVWAKNGCQGSTIRYWDSCMFSEYSQMAGGHNPRPGRKEKVRQRFLHKLSYFPERYGKFLCTGCGRCFVSCPAGLEITQVIRQVREAKIDG